MNTIWTENLPPKNVQINCMDDFILAQKNYASFNTYFWGKYTPEQLYNDLVENLRVKLNFYNITAQRGSVNV